MNLRLRPFLLSAASVLAGLAAVSVLRADDTTAAPSANRPQFIYVLRSNDHLQVQVFQEPDLTQDTRVDGLGNVNLPLIGEVQVSGLTVTEAEKAIEDAYHNGRYLVHPQVTIAIEEYALREVKITGAVKDPGRFELPTETPWYVEDLVTKAGGFTDVAQGSDVSITRTTREGKQLIRKVDVNSILKGKKPAKDPANMLLPDDIVYVPERLI